MSKLKKVICIVGPTASGKTNLSLALANIFRTEIINCDSVQVYQELNIGSAKITLLEQQNIKHHLLDIVSVGTDYSIYDFQKDARLIIDQIKLPILVGGSGLYLKSALFNYDLKKRTQQALPSLDEMITALKLNYPNQSLDYENPYRVTSYYQQHIQNFQINTNQGKDEPLYDILTLYLDIDRQTLRQRVSQRIDLMLNQGLIEEVNDLLKKGYDLNIIGYKQISRYLKNEITLQEAKELIINATMQYAKRQKTWFKHQMPTISLNALDPDLIDKSIKIIKEFINE